jgi:excisionase family DNA binding protein
MIDPPDSAPLPGFVGLKEASFACGFSDETVRQWARDGEVTATKQGGAWRVELASVMERARRKPG